MFWKKRTYLDYASVAPVTAVARRAFTRAAVVFGNPSSPHEEGRRARDILEVARTQIARLVEAKSDDVIFTSGATEANNLAIRGLVRPGSHVLYLPSAHASIVEAVRSLEGVIVEPLSITGGQIDIDALKKQIKPGTVLVTVEAVCGETGTIWNTRAVAHALATHVGHTMSNIWLHVDASQAPLTQKITRSHFGADLLTFDAQKIGGMRGAGVLVASRTIPLLPIMFGGGQERGLRSGTPAPALATAFAAALTESVLARDAFVKGSTAVHEKLKARILTTIPHAYINAGDAFVPNILNLSFPGHDTDYLVTLLDTAGFAVSTRSACETDSSEGSRAVFILTRDRDRALTTLRISWGRETSHDALDRFFVALHQICYSRPWGTPTPHSV